MHRKLRDFLLVEGIQEIKFDTVMSIHVTAGNGPMKQQRLATITCYKCGQKVIIERTAITQLAQAQYQNKNQHTVPLLL